MLESYKMTEFGFSQYETSCYMALVAHPSIERITTQQTIRDCPVPEFMMVLNTFEAPKEWFF